MCFSFQFQFFFPSKTLASKRADHLYEEKQKNLISACFEVSSVCCDFSKLVYQFLAQGLQLPAALACYVCKNMFPNIMPTLILVLVVVVTFAKQPPLHGHEEKTSSSSRADDEKQGE